MKYYVYVSDTKLDMYYGKIPQNFLKKISVELGINLPFISLTLKERKNNLKSQETARYQKLDIVTNYLKNNYPMGSIDKPNEFFEGTLPMRYVPNTEKNIALFVGKTNETSLALTGSYFHMVSPIPEARMTFSGSGVYVASIFEDLEEALKRIDTNDKSTLFNTLGIESIIPLMRGPEQELEFLARKLYYKKRRPDEKYILIGTPIYVSFP